MMYCSNNSNQVTIQVFRTGTSWQTAQTPIRLLLEEKSDQGLHCLLFVKDLGFGYILKGIFRDNTKREKD